MMASLAVLWGCLYLASGERLAASIPLCYSAIVIRELGAFAWVRRYGLFRISQLALSLLLPFFLMLALGGFVASSAVILWSLTSPLGALANRLEDARRRIGLLELAGKRESVEVWEALQPEVADRLWLRANEQAYERMANGDLSALRAYRAPRNERPDDALVRVHLQRLEAGEQGVVVSIPLAVRVTQAEETALKKNQSAL